MTLKITQGDAYAIPFRLKQDGNYLTPDMIQDVEVTIGSTFRKRMSDGGVIYQNERWYFYLSQDDTLELLGAERIHVRVRYSDQPWVTVIGKRAAMICVEEHPNAEVM